MTSAVCSKIRVDPSLGALLCAHEKIHRINFQPLFLFWFLSSGVGSRYLEFKSRHFNSHFQHLYRVPTDQGNQGIQGKFLRLFPVREIREKQGFFSQNQGKKFQIRELFFQTIFKPFKPINLRKMFFKTVKPQELSGNCNICID